jgi:uncharacterized protein (TIGR02118 family)
MIKRMSILTRRSDVDVAQFRRHWATTHAAILKRVWPQTRGYVQNAWSGPGPNDIRPTGPHVLDGVVQLWFDDETALSSAVSSPGGTELFADGALFIAGVTTFLVEEHVPKAGPRGAVKRLSLIRCKPGVDRATFRREWLDVHPPFVDKGFQRATRYTQNLVTDDQHDHVLASGGHSVDGFVEIWWRNAEEMTADMASASVAAMKAHADVFIGELSSSLVDERVVIDPGTIGKNE